MFNDSLSIVLAAISQDVIGATNMPEIPFNFFEISRLYEEHFEVVRADTSALLDRVYEIRYQVYCVENAFEDPAQNLGGREIDADDDRSAHVLLIHRESGEAAGTARVIFPDSSHRRPLPIERILDPDGQRHFHRLPGQATGEVSRFAVSKAFRQRRGEDRYADIGLNSPTAQSSPAERRIMPFITFGLIRGIVGICLPSGISHITAVMEPPLIRLLKRVGLDFQSVGGLVEYHGLRQPCVASLDDLIDHARGESSTLWLYAKDEVSRHSGPSLSIGSTAVRSSADDKRVPYASRSS
jgi:N-acyl amino acid synthase of PEP-CTERM/exosortase system